MSKFSEGASSSYAELPVEVNYLYWKRGNGQLSHLREIDPGAFFGGWTASVKNAEGEDMAALPLPVVTRVSDDGSAEYQRYASNVINFLPIAFRQRYEKREEVIDTKTGRKAEKVTAVVKEYISGVHSGFQPMKQIFGLIFSADMSTYAPVVLKLNKWSSYISFGKAAQSWAKTHAPEGKELVRRYGTIGIKNKQNAILPNFETFNEGKSTPIEAIDIHNPIFIDLTPELDELWEGSQAWAKCDRWNASGRIVDESTTNSLPPMPEPSEEFPFGDPSQD